jgi:hypothetical protein
MGEKKILEYGDVVVTTERLIYGPKVVQLDDISGSALPNAMLPWGNFASGGILGLLMLMCGFPMIGYGWKILGLLLILIGVLLFAALFYLIKYPERWVQFSVNGEIERIEVKSAEFASELANAINKGISDRKIARLNALQNEISNLPSA